LLAYGGRLGKSAAEPKTVVQIRKMRKQEGCAEGEVRWFCDSCMDGFCAPKGETPDNCAKGHPRQVVDDLSSAAGDATETSTEG
jgi:hypothetical protein